MKLNALTLALGFSVMTLGLAGCGSSSSSSDNDDPTPPAPVVKQTISLEQAGRSASQGYDESAAEIVDFDTQYQRVFTVNANSGEVDVFDAQDVTAINQPMQRLNMAQMLVANGKVADAALVGAANSVSIKGDYVAVAVQAEPKTDNGWVVFVNLSDLTYANAVQVGALPDMVTFTPDGTHLLVANEGEPVEGYGVDPEGSIGVIKMADFSLTLLGFEDFNVGGARHDELPLDKIILDGYSPTTLDNLPSVAQSMEPEYIAVSADSTQAYVALQENNAVAVVNLADLQIEKIYGLGFKDHSLEGNALDASNKDGVNIQNWPVMGAYMPDSVAAMAIGDKTYLLTANEGDSREDWLNGVTDDSSCVTAGYYFHGDKCRDELALKDLDESDLTLGSGLADLNRDDALARLKFSYFVTKAKNGGTEINTLYAYGGRSFSIWDMSNGEQVFDSGDFFETHTAEQYGAEFNNNNDENAGDDRSDNKGPEPEAITVGQVNDRLYAFIGLERMGGIMVYDVTDPSQPEFVQYVNNRKVDPAVQPGGDATSYSPDIGDLGPEGFKFVAATDSPNGKPLLVVGSEVSGTTTIYNVVVSQQEGSQSTAP